MQELKSYMHYPNLKTILAVEEVLKKDDELMSRNEIMRRLENKIQRQTLNIVLEYLHESGKITESSKGVIWVYNPSKKLAKAIENGVRVA